MSARDAARAELLRANLMLRSLYHAITHPLGATIWTSIADAALKLLEEQREFINSFDGYKVPEVSNQPSEPPDEAFRSPEGRRWEQSLDLPTLIERFYEVRAQRDRLLRHCEIVLSVFDDALSQGHVRVWSGKAVDEMRATVEGVRSGAEFR